jgi:hypothetical protein
VSKVETMQFLFYKSAFKQDLSDWKPYNLNKIKSIQETFKECSAVIPYWYNYDNQKERNEAVDNYWIKKNLNKELNTELSLLDSSSKKQPKI